jgi:hypothetical protein
MTRLDDRIRDGLHEAGPAAARDLVGQRAAATIGTPSAASRWVG